MVSAYQVIVIIAVNNRNANFSDSEAPPKSTTSDRLSPNEYDSKQFHVLVSTELIQISMDLTVLSRELIDV